jgi:hypothetical protein
MTVYWGGILAGKIKHLYFFIDEWDKCKGANFVGMLLTDTDVNDHDFGLLIESTAYVRREFDAE